MDRMTKERGLFRVRDALGAIDQLKSLFGGLSYEAIESDPINRRAFERYFEIVSEACRHIPDGWKQGYAPDISWREIAGIGDILRHAYRHVDHAVLWATFRRDLDPLAAALRVILAAEDPGDETARPA